MSKTGTSNEVSTKKKEKNLLSKYPYKVWTDALFFGAGERELQETIYNMVGLPGADFVTVKLENGSKDRFDQIPVKRSTAKKRTSKKPSSSNIAEER